MTASGCLSMYHTLSSLVADNMRISAYTVKQP